MVEGNRPQKPRKSLNKHFNTVLESQDSEKRKMKEFTEKNLLNNLENMLPCFREQLCVVQCLLGQNHLSVFSVQHRTFPPRGTKPCCVSWIRTGSCTFSDGFVHVCEIQFELLELQSFSHTHTHTHLKQTLASETASGGC